MSDYSFSVVFDRLDEILEAVRALQPAPDPIRETTNNVYQAFLAEQEAANSCRMKLRIAHEEIERLQAKVAEDALTIGALKDTLAKLDENNRELCSIVDEHAAELKRFREREEKVTELLDMVVDEVKLLRFLGGHAATANQLENTAAAVRDFKVSEP